MLQSLAPRHKAAQQLHTIAPIYNMRSKTALFYLCSNFVKPFSIPIIFRTRINQIHLLSLAYFKFIVRSKTGNEVKFQQNNMPVYRASRRCTGRRALCERLVVCSMGGREVVSSWGWIRTWKNCKRMSTAHTHKHVCVIISSNLSVNKITRGNIGRLSTSHNQLFGGREIGRFITGENLVFWHQL